MTKTKKIDESGTVLNVPKETIQRKPITVSYSEAKKMTKKPMSEAQSEHVKKMVDANRIKWEEKRKAKDEISQKQTATLKKQIEEEEVEEVVVLPKRVYPARKKQVEEDLRTDIAIDATRRNGVADEPIKPKKKRIVYVEESEEEESEEEIIVKKPKAKNTIVKQKVEETTKAINKIDQILNPYRSVFGL
jgi:hypothetical protein